MDLRFNDDRQRLWIDAWTGGAARVAGSTFEANGTGVGADLNSAVEVRDGSRVAGNLAEGIAVSGSSTLNIEETVVENNGAQGIFVHQGSLVRVYGTTIRGNQLDGITLSDLSIGTGGSVPPGDDPVQILDNGGWGISCAGPSAITEAQSGFDDAGLGEVIFSWNTNGDTNCP